MSLQAWIEYQKHPCPQCGKETIPRFCSYKCGMEYKRKEQEEQTKEHGDG